MKNKKALKLFASLALVATIGVGATLAYLTDQSNIVTNSFTVGDGYKEDDNLKQAVWIDEKKVGTKEVEEKIYTIGNEERTLKGNTYTDVMPGYSYTKDPVLRINKGSVKSYAFIQVSGLDILESFGVTVDLNKDDWKKVSTSTGTVVDVNTEVDKTLDGIYMYFGGDDDGVLDPTAAVAFTSPLFTKVTFAGSFNQTSLTDKDIILKGCAVQAAVYNDDAETILNQAQIDTPSFKTAN